MQRTFINLAGKLLLLIAATSSTALFAQSENRVHRKAMVVDTHNDILMKVTENAVVFDQDLTGKTHSDLKRWQKGGLDVQLFSVYCDGAQQNAFSFAISGTKLAALLNGLNARRHCTVMVSHCTWLPIWSAVASKSSSRQGHDTAGRPSSG